MVEKNPSRKEMEEWVADYLESYDDYNDAAIREYVEGQLPVYYSNIMKCFQHMQLEITEAHVGRPIWAVMQEEIFNEWYNFFIEVIEEREDFNSSRSGS